MCGKLTNDKKFRSRSAYADCADQYDSIFFVDALKPLFKRNSSFICRSTHITCNDFFFNCDCFLIRFSGIESFDSSVNRQPITFCRSSSLILCSTDNVPSLLPFDSLFNRLRLMGPPL